MPIIYTEKECQKFIDSALDLQKSNMRFEDIFKYIITKRALDKAVLYFDEDNKLRSYNYKTYGEYAYSLARHLASALKDIHPNAPVGLKMRNTPNWPLLFWAILMNGHPVLLIDARLEHANTENLLAQAKAEAIVVNEFDPYSVLSLRLNEIQKSPEVDSFAPHWADEAMFCSSGTTGDIKIMVMPGKAICNQIIASHNMPLESTTIMHPGKINILAMLPLHHIFGFSAVLMWYSFYGKTLVYPAGMSAGDLKNACKKGKCTHIFSVPLVWDSVAQGLKRSMEMANKRTEKLFNKIMGYNLGELTKKEAGILASSKFMTKFVQRKLFGSQVQFCISGGGYLNADTAKTINGVGYPLYNGFGMTEAGICSVELSKDVKTRLKCSIGHSLYGIEYKLKKDEEGKKQGELMIKSELLHSEEIIGGVRKKAEYEDGFMATGDIAEIGEDGRVYIKGRLKDTIIGANGENIFPDEIETYFQQIPGVEHVCVFGYSRGMDERIILVTELSNTVASDEFPEIKKKLDEINDKIPSGKKVSEFYVYKKVIPISNSMKAKRFAVKKDFSEHPENFVDFIQRQKTVVSFEGFDSKEVEETIKTVKKVFAKTLLLPDYKIANEAIWNVELGGDSMSYIQMIQDLEITFSITIPTELYGKLGTVNDFAFQVLTLKKPVGKQGKHKGQ